MNELSEQRGNDSSTTLMTSHCTVIEDGLATIKQEIVEPSSAIVNSGIGESIFIGKIPVPNVELISGMVDSPDPVMHSDINIPVSGNDSQEFKSEEGDIVFHTSEGRVKVKQFNLPVPMLHSTHGLNLNPSMGIEGVSAQNMLGTIPDKKFDLKIEEMEEINTTELAQRITFELKRYGIPQAVFAQRVLHRTQGTLSDLLKKPKPWSKMKSGRKTFRKMWKWLQEPACKRMSALGLAESTLIKDQPPDGSDTHHQTSLLQPVVKEENYNFDESTLIKDQPQDGNDTHHQTSLPQPVVKEENYNVDSSLLSLSMSLPSGGLAMSSIGMAEDVEVMQYNYVNNLSQNCLPINSSTSVSLEDSPPVSLTGSSSSVALVQPNAGNQMISTKVTPGTAVYGTMLVNQPEAKHLIEVGPFTIINGLLSCPYCEYKGKNMVQLRRHLQQTHKESSHFECRLCDREFTTKGGLKYHSRTVHRQQFAYWCEVCCKGYKGVQYYQAHMTRHHGPGQYKCKDCDKEFSLLATLLVHRKSCLGNKLAFEMSAETLSNDKDLNEHTMTESCDVHCICGAEFNCRADLDIHKAECSNEIVEKKKCSLRPQETDNLSNTVLNPESLSTKTKQIVPVSIKFEENVDRKTNIDFHENISDCIPITNVESGEQFKCDVTANDNRDSFQVSTPSGMMYSCQDCYFKTEKSSEMKIHKLIHTRWKYKYKCNDCPKSFNDLTRLTTHQKSKHRIPAQFTCDECSCTFASKGCMKYHKRTRHKNSYKYRCETCDKAFNVMEHYLNHKDKHIGKRWHLCKNCSVGFMDQSVLTAHKRVCKGKTEGSTADGLDMYPCKDCEISFTLPSLLQQHMKEVHSTGTTIDNKYMCDCGEMFEKRTLYESHKSGCSKSDKSSEMILQMVSVEADITENAEVDISENEEADITDNVEVDTTENIEADITENISSNDEKFT